MFPPKTFKKNYTFVLIISIIFFYYAYFIAHLIGTAPKVEAKC